MYRFVLLITIAMFSQLASKAVSLEARNFVFPKGATEWSEPLEFKIGSEKMEKKGVGFVSVTVRIRAIKKIAMGCRYEIEVTCTDERGVRFEIANNDYKVKLKVKSGETEKGTIDSFTRGCKGLESCGDCSSPLKFYDVEVM